MRGVTTRQLPHRMCRRAAAPAADGASTTAGVDSTVTPTPPAPATVPPYAPAPNPYGVGLMSTYGVPDPAPAPEPAPAHVAAPLPAAGAPADTAAGTEVAAAASPLPPSTNLFFKRLDGTVLSASVGLDATFRSIKGVVAPLVSLPESIIRFVCRGEIVPDDATPSSQRLVAETVIHVVARRGVRCRRRRRGCGKGRAGLAAWSRQFPNDARRHCSRVVRPLLACR